MDATSLPTTCGESVEIPGVPCVGCVAVLSCGADTATGFSCCVVGSLAEVYLLGPNLRQRDGSVVTARLWCAPCGAVPARVTSLVAFSLHSVHSGSALRGGKSTAQSPDTACAVVAWRDAGESQHHIGALFFSPRRVLAAQAVEPAVMHETSFVHMRGALQVLRLFYHPLFSAQSEVTHVVLCSCYDERPRREAREAPGEGRETLVLHPMDPQSVRAGHIAFVECAAPTSDVEVQSHEAHAAEWHKEATAAVAPWLAGHKCEGVVCAVAVQGMSSHVIAALGTVNGCVILLYRDGARAVHRFGGPIADLAFVSTRSAPGEERYQNDAVNHILQGDRLLRTPSNVSFSVTPDNIIPDSGDDVFMCLVVLDSIGRVIILRAVNSGAPILQIVSDIRQFITLAGRRAPCQSTSTPLEEPLGSRPVSVSSKSFFELSSLLLFFQRKRQKEPRVGLKEINVAYHMKGEPEANRRTLREEAHAAGNILSRGLLCLTSTLGPRGRVELLVSTMGHCIVSIPFDVVEGTFSVAGFIVAPVPMFFLGFVDFFNTGVPELVMAGSNYVLLARRSRRHQRHRASMLIQLLTNMRDSSDNPVESVRT